jgi:hypothetical protein
MGEERGVYRDLVEKPEGNRPLGRPRRNGRITLRRIFRKLDVEVWTGLSLLRIGQLAGTCECGKEPSCSIKYREFLDWLQTG